MFFLHRFQSKHRMIVFSREKQNQLQSIQTHLNQNSELVTRENQVLREFRKELDMLVQERMSHIEELRLIHADINIVCGINHRLNSFVKIRVLFLDGNNDQTSRRRTCSSSTRK